MHDSLLVEGLLDEVFRLAKQKMNSSVRKIRLNLGREGHISPESLCLHFKAQSQGALAEGASLEIEPVSEESLFLVSFGFAKVLFWPTILLVILP